MHVSITFIAGDIRAAQTIASGDWEPDYDVEEVDGADYFDGIREEEIDPEKIWVSELFDIGPADSSGISRIRLSGEKCRAKVKRTVEAANTLAGLMEFSWQGNFYLGVVEHLLNNEWKGDRVLLIGDYAEDYIEDQENWAELEYIRYLTSLADEFGTADLFSIDAEELENISWQQPLRYIINDKAKSYIDRKEQPIQWSYEYEGNLIFARIDPLSLVLAAGNGLGGGDYHGYDENMVGIWADCAGFIRTADSVPEDYSYADIVFSENGQDQFREYDFGECWEYISETNLEIIKDMISKTGATLANADDFFLTGEELAELYRKEDRHGRK